MSYEREGQPKGAAEYDVLSAGGLQSVFRFASVFLSGGCGTLTPRRDVARLLAPTEIVPIMSRASDAAPGYPRRGREAMHVSRRLYRLFTSFDDLPGEEVSAGTWVL
ncbi:jg18902 [Pararge aegeria aegeria]|uniref:Jg18902 protein n=1 Tax=Pararge aegeria aegeria TaxID=348720 RepID=A0A8S4QVT3_9NEOP|nr:jg18902 [Pararge aegeria aegeria]